MAWNVDLAGETIPMARERIAEGAEKAGLNVTFSSQITDHGASRRSTGRRWRPPRRPCVLPGSVVAGEDDQAPIRIELLEPRGELIDWNVNRARHVRLAMPTISLNMRGTP